MIPIIWEYVAHKITEISSLTYRDWVYITASYWSILNRMQDQNEVLKRRGFSEEQIKAVSKQKVVHSEEVAGLHFTEPVTKYRYDLLDYVDYLFTNYEKGILPSPGSASEQPAQIIEIFNLIQLVKNEYKIRQSRSQDNGRFNKNQNRTGRRRR